MDRASSTGSSILRQSSTSAYNASSGSSLMDPRKRGKKPSTKVEIHNQDLNDAIREVRSNVRNNPEWHLNVKKVVEKYPPKQSTPQPIGEVDEGEAGSPEQKQHALPNSRRMDPPRLQLVVKPKANPLEQLKFTERKKVLHQQKLQQLEQKRMEREALLLQKQMRAKLERKIKENLKLKERKAQIQDIEERRAASLRLRDSMAMKRREEGSMIHESNIANVKMIRKVRKQTKNQELSDTRSLSQDSEHVLKYRKQQRSLKQLENKEILLNRYRNLRCSSQHNLRRLRDTESVGPRYTRTAESNRRSEWNPSTAFEES